MRVGVVDQGTSIKLAVYDTGMGISPDFLPHLFDEFQQESSGLTRKHGGNGLGLAITKRLVEAMGGDIRVQSKKHVGTIFTITLPVKAAKPEGRDTDSESAAHAPAGAEDRPPQMSERPQACAEEAAAIS